MELMHEMLKEILAKEEINIIFPNLNFSVSEILEMESYKALQKIKAVILDDDLSDEKCFMKIEEIIVIFENIGSNGGFRHDF